jgi:hypothetical protein
MPTSMRTCFDNYDLPMDDASRMARAQEMGDRTKGYHGTISPNEIQSFEVGNVFDDNGDIIAAYSGDPNSLMGPHFATTEKPANDFAIGNVQWRNLLSDVDAGGSVYPVDVYGRPGKG